MTVKAARKPRKVTLGAAFAAALRDRLQGKKPKRNPDFKIGGSGSCVTIKSSRWAPFHIAISARYTDVQILMKTVSVKHDFEMRNAQDGLEACRYALDEIRLAVTEARAFFAAQQSPSPEASL